MWMDLESVLQTEVRKRKTLHINAYIWNLGEKNSIDTSTCRAGIEKQTQRMDPWTHWGRHRWDKLGNHSNIF